MFKAVEFLAEWSLCPNNVAYLRIQTGIFDPSLIGDKAKWYCRYLTPVQFKTYEEKTTLAAAIQFYNQENAKNLSAEQSLTDDSVSSEPDDIDAYYYSSNNFTENSENTSKQQEDELLPEKSPLFTADGKPIGMFPKNQATTMCVDVVSVYSPPIETDTVDNDLSPSRVSTESSALTSSASSSSSVCSIDNENNLETSVFHNTDQIMLKNSEDNG